MIDLIVEFLIKLKLIAAIGNYPWGPGEVLRYRTSDTFVLAVAMDRFIKSKEGPNADLWSLITREVLQPIGIAHMPVLHTKEPNRARGIPLLGIGIEIYSPKPLIPSMQN